MKIRTYLVAVLCLGIASLSAQEFGIVENDMPTSILIDKSDAKVVHIATDLFVRDVKSISGKSIPILSKVPKKSPSLIVVGTLDSKYIKQLEKEQKITVSNLKDTWENYSIQHVENPFKGVESALVIIGSDRRGAAYSILELSRKMGVSPWEWWADVAPEKQKNIRLTIENETFTGPSVKYRGVFLNDEDWGLERWATLNYEPEAADMGPKTYAKIFELLLRLRANTIWPAMHSSTEPFYSFPDNKKVVDDYAIVIGTSHAEPMLSNINMEWDHSIMGEYRYDTNAETIKKLFAKRVAETSKYEGIYTTGMRGEHDSPMIMGEDDTDAQVQLLEKVITDQRALLEKEFKKPAATVPQAFVPYKEVLNYYQNGLKLPEDVTLVWTDDNYGYIRQLSTPEEQKRSGGAGVYYHTSYWGRPHDYLWLNSTNPILMWEEMSKAYAFGSQTEWILNCGDIKPHEYNIELFLDMAWNMDDFATSTSVTEHSADWVSSKFGSENSLKITKLITENNRLSFIRRPEFMAWSQVEPVTKANETQMTQFHYGDEVAERIGSYEAIIAGSNEMYETIPEIQKDAYFQLVHYPLTAAGNMNLKWLYHFKNQFVAKQGRHSALYFGKKSENAFQEIERLTTYYNDGIKNGKWKHIMNASPRYLPVFDDTYTIAPRNNEKPGLGLALESYEMEVNSKSVNSFADVLPVFNAYIQNEYYIDVFLKGKAATPWKALPRAPWIQISSTEGTLNEETLEQRLWVSLDWSSLPQGANKKEAPLGHDYQLIPPSYKVNSAIDFISNNDTITVGISAYNPKFKNLEDYEGFVEDKGFVSIHAENYSQINKGMEAEWEVVEGLGYSGKVVVATPNTADSRSTQEDMLTNSPFLTYDFYTFNFGEAKVALQAIPTHAQNKEYGVRCAVAIDDAEPVLIDFQTVGRSEEWKENVLRNAAIGTADQIVDRAGKHTLKIWMVDPGVLLDKVLIDLGGWKSSYDFPKETKIRK